MGHAQGRRVAGWAALVILFFGTLAFGAYGVFGIRITPAQVLGANTWHHAPTPVPWAQRLLSYRQSDGIVTRGVEVVRQDAVATVLYLGGSGFTLDRYGHLVTQAFAGIPVNVVVYDMRGFGRSGGKPNLARSGEDVLALYRHTVATSRLPVIVHGHSLGTFLASDLAAHSHAAWLVLEAPGTTPADFVRSHLPWWLADWAVVHATGVLATANNLDWLRAATARIVVVAGTADPVLPYTLATRLVAGLPASRTRLVTCRGAGHDDMWRYGCFAQAYTPLLETLRLARLDRSVQSTPSQSIAALP